MAYGSGKNSPYGLKPRFDLISTTDNGQAQTYQIASGYSTSLFAGDRVALSATTGTLVIAPAGTPSIGVLQQVSYVDTLGNPVKQPFWAANTVTQNALVATAWVYNDPMLVFDVQISTSVNPASKDPSDAPSIIQTMIGKNANLAIGGGGANVVPQNPTSGSTVTGQSAYYLDSQTIGVDSTLDVKIISINPVVGNAFGIPYNSALVQLNNDVYKGNGTGFTNDPAKFTSVTGTYTATLADEIILGDPTGGAFTITLPAAALGNRTKQYVIKNIAGANNITVQTVDTGGTITPGSSARYVSNGTTWYKID